MIAMDVCRKNLFAFLLVPALALVCALLANALAQPSRKLAWTGRPLAPVILAPVTPTTLPPSSSPTATVPVKPAPVPRNTTLKPVDLTTPPLDPFAFHPEHPCRELSGEGAQAAFQRGLPFLDSRRTEHYEMGHIPGAWPVSVWETDLDDRVLAFESVVRPAAKDPLILYCTGGDCEDSHRLAQKLMQMGYRNLWIYLAGWPDWTSKDRPVKQGAER